MRKKTEPAFPMVFNDNSWHEGISIRDYFAAKALTGMLAYSINNSCNQANDSCDDIVVGAYKFADAMLKAREE